MRHSCVFVTARAYIKTPVTALEWCFDIMKGLKLSAEKMVIWKKSAAAQRVITPPLTLSLW